MNDELIQAFGEYLAVEIQTNLQKNEAAQNLLNVLGKPILEESTKADKPTEAQFNGLGWTKKKGTRGDYQQSENDNSEAFKNLSQYVKAHGGFANLFGWKLWMHNSNENLIDRKR